MVVKLADRVSESAQATGTGAFTLGGPSETQYIAFSTAFTTGDLTSYVAVQGEKWEIGTGTLLSETQLSRDFVWNTSDQTGVNSQNIPGSSLPKISFDSGTTITIFVGLPSHLVLALDENGDLLDPTPFRNVIFIETLTAMKALTGLSDGESVIVLEDIVGGIFTWDATDSTSADNIDTFRNDASSGVGLHKRASLRVQASFDGSLTVDAASGGDSTIDLFTAKKASNANSYFRWFTDAANNAFGLAARVGQVSLTNFFKIYSSGNNADRWEFLKPFVVGIKSNLQGLKAKTLLWNSGASKLALTLADAADNTTAATSVELALTKGGYIVSDVLDVYALKQVDPIASGFSDGDKAVARGSNTSSGSSSAVNSGNTKPLIYYWSSTSTATADDIKVVRPSVGNAATGNGRWLILVSDITKTMASGDASPTVAGCEWLITAGSTAITNFDDGYEGQGITVERASADIVITHDPAKINLGSNRTLTATSPRASFRLVGSVWKSIDGADIADRIQNSLTAGETGKGAAQDIILSSLKATGGQNLIYNSSFDIGAGTIADGFRSSVSGGVTLTASLVASPLMAKGKAQQFVLSGLTSSLIADLAIALNSRYYMDIEPLQTYTFGVWCVVPADLTGRIFIQFGTVSGNTFTVTSGGTYSTSATAGTGALQFLSITGAGPAGATHAVVIMRTAGAAGTSGTVLWDNAQLEKGSIPTAWRDSKQAPDIVLDRLFNITGRAQTIPLRQPIERAMPGNAVNIMDGWGAVGDGVADDTTAMQAAINFVSAHAYYNAVYIPAHTTILATQLTISTSGVQIIGGGPTAILKKSGENELLRIWGSLGTQYSVPSAPANRAKVITTTTSGPPFASGEWALLESQHSCYNDGGSVDGAAYAGEFVCVRSVVTTTTTLHRPITWTYQPTNNQKLTKVNWLTGVRISNLRIIMNPSSYNTTGSSSLEDAFAICARYCQGLVVDHCEFSDGNYAAVTLSGCLHCTVEDNYFHDFASADDDVSGGFGYGVGEIACNYGNLITGNHFTRVRTAYTTAFGKSAVWKVGVPMFTLVTGNVSLDTWSGSFSTHPAGFGVQITNNMCIGARNNAIQVRAKHTVIRGNFIAYCEGFGILALQETADRTGPNAGTIIDGNEIMYSNLGSDTVGTDHTSDPAISISHCDAVVMNNIIRYSGGPAIGWRDGAVICKNNIAFNPCQITTTAKFAFGVLTSVTEGTQFVSSVDGNICMSSDSRTANLISKPAVAFFRGSGNRGQGMTGTEYAGENINYSFTDMSRGASIAAGTLIDITIASDAITLDADTVTSSKIRLAPQSGGGGADNLYTITGGYEGQMIFLRVQSGATITIKHGANSTNNIRLAGAADVVLTSTDKLICLVMDLGLWKQPALS